MLRKMYLVSGSCLEEDGHSFTWVVGVYTEERVALDVAHHAGSICDALINTYGYRLLELIDGKVQRQMEKRFGPVTEENVNSKEYIATYKSLRRGVVEQYNPYDPEMHIDTSYWQPSTYEVEELDVDRVPVLAQATVEELTRHEGESEDIVATQKETTGGEGEQDT